jgi:hypothetical protein
MVSRIVSCTIDPAKVNEFRTALNNKLLPRIQSQPGFIENIESLDPTTGQFCCVTLWRTEKRAGPTNATRSGHVQLPTTPAALGKKVSFVLNSEQDLRSLGSPPQRRGQS